ncbi:MAG: DUF4397 domain-containing protein [Cellulosilyticaceae bacterium]
MSDTSKSHVSFGYIRFFHALPTEKTFSLYLDDQLIHKTWDYEDFTPYIKYPAGQHLLTIKHKKDTTPIYEKRLNVKPESAFTYTFSSHPKKQDTLHLFVLEDTKKVINGPYSCIRFGHFATSVPKVKLQSGTEHLFFKNIAYSQLSHYMPIQPQPYPFELVTSEEDTDITSLKKHLCKLGRLYTLYLIGTGDKAFPYKLVPSIDGPSFLPLKKPSSAL